MTSIIIGGSTRVPRVALLKQAIATAPTPCLIPLKRAAHRHIAVSMRGVVSV
jgi:hypothetical protein